jgi:ABC-type phosphate/phosphonate transport system substrate-binding protein
MTSRNRLRVCALLWSCLGLLGLGTLLCRAENNAAVRVGMVQTFFHDVPKPLVEFVTEPFGDVMKEATGLAGRLAVGGEALDVARQLHEGTLDLAVFHGHEFAWAQQKYADLRPLMVAVNRHHNVQAFVLTRKDCEAGCFSDLKGKEVSIPRRTREHCQVFIARECAEGGAKAFFGKVLPSANVETALDAVCSGTICACVTDTIGVEFYKELKPGCFNRLKIIKTSEEFPPPVIAYRQGALDDTTLAQVRTGLLNAHNLELGREMMKMWKIHTFQPTPDNYTQALADILKAYPAPESPAKVSRR